jgi:hypothetical protein
MTSDADARTRTGVRVRSTRGGSSPFGTVHREDSGWHRRQGDEPTAFFASTVGRRGEIRANEPRSARSSLSVVAFDSACHAGGRGFESLFTPPPRTTRQHPVTRKLDLLATVGSARHRHCPRPPHRRSLARQVRARPSPRDPNAAENTWPRPELPRAAGTRRRQHREAPRRLTLPALRAVLTARDRPGIPHAVRALQIGRGCMPGHQGSEPATGRDRGPPRGAPASH